MFRTVPTLILVLLANVSMADWIAEVVPDPYQEPYRYTGRLESYEWYGSGAVVGDERTVITAAHVLFDEDSKNWLGQIEWRLRNEYPSRTIRSYRHLADYADMVDEHGDNSSEAFNSDMAILFSYETLSDGGFGEISDSAESDLTSAKQKLSVGFPSGIYDYGHPDNNKMHRTGPFASSFFQIHQQYYGVHNASLGPGGSGGGLWIQNESGWECAATNVSGLTKSTGHDENVMGVVALSGGKRSLLEDVFDELSTYIPPQITAEPPELVLGELEEESFITVEYNSNEPVTEVVWEYWDPEFPEIGFRTWWIEHGDLLFDETHTVLTIPSRTYFLHDKILRVLVRNKYGGSYSREFRFKYDLPPLPLFTMQPESQVLRNNAPAILEARINLTGESTLRWERKPYGSSDFTDFGPANKVFPRLEIGGSSGYYNGDQFRLAAFDGIRTFYSEAATLSWTDLGLKEVILISAPPEFLHWGDYHAIEIGMTGTVDCSFTWKFTNPAGERVQVPRGFSVTRGLYGHNSKLWIINNSESVNGYTIEVIANAAHYEQQAGGNERTQESRSLFTWTLSASGPNSETSDYQVSYNEKLHQLSATVGDLDGSPREIFWQASTDGGNRWHPLDSNTDGELNLKLDKLLEQGTAIRAIIKQADEPIIHTRRIPVILGAPQTITKSGAESTVTVYWMSGMALSPDSSTIAYCQYDGNQPIRILERNGESWQETAVLELEGINTGVNEIQFLSNTRILVSLPIATVGQILGSGSIIEITKQEDGSWTPGNTISLPNPERGEGFSRVMDYSNGYLIASVAGRPVPFNIFRLVDGGWEICEIEEVPANANSSMSYTSHVAISGDTALARGDRICLYLKRADENTWVFKDSHILSEAFAPVYLQPNGNLLVHDQSRLNKLGTFEEWHLNESDQLEKVPAEAVTFGPPENIFHPSAIASYNGMHGMVNHYESFGIHWNSAILTKNDAVTGKRLVASFQTPPNYKIQYISIAEEYIALQIDNTKVSPEDDAWWQVWLIPIDQVEFNPIDAHDWPISLDASLADTGQSSPATKLRFRESYNPPVPVSIQSSHDGTSWTQLAEEDYVRTVLNPDIDGDNKTALIEVEIPLPTDDSALLLRAVEE